MQSFNVMNGTIVRFYAKDGLILNGFLIKSKKKNQRIIIHVHGMTGNFYKWFGLWKMIRIFIDRGYDFFTFDTRGSGVVSSFKRKKGKKKLDLLEVLPLKSLQTVPKTFRGQLVLCVKLATEK